MSTVLSWSPCMSTMPRYHVLFLVFSLFFITEVSSLDCYTCTSGLLSACGTVTTSCASGEVCSNEVFKRYFLTTIYDRDCMDRSSCLTLANLNDNRYCSVAPSSCTYCCDNDLCNGSDPRIVAKSAPFCLFMWIALMWSVIL